MVEQKKVYVIGAGFSAGLGYPLANNLLIEVWDRMSRQDRTALHKVIRFHYPNFNPKHKTTFPYIEALLTKMRVNLDMFDMSRPADGNFTKKKLLNLEGRLLYAISIWFHELYKGASDANWLQNFVGRLNRENAIVISFNWDLVLDYELFSDGLDEYSYGFKARKSAVKLLKPHGSLNWYAESEVASVNASLRTTIYPGVEVFMSPRKIGSRKGNQYKPMIVAPSYIKDFTKPVYEKTWQACTNALSRASEVTFIGYSLPADDTQAQFILRCGFHNQINGRLGKYGTRLPATGASKVTIINPDQEAAKRIIGVVGPRVQCNWIPERAQDWANRYCKPPLFFSPEIRRNIRNQSNKT